jgi:hypothetical protein
MKPIGFKALVLIALPLLLSVHHASANGWPPKTIVGTWVVEVQPDQSSGVEATVNIATAGRNGLTPGDGTVVNLDPTVGTAVGTWRYLGGSTYKTTFSGFVGAATRYVVRATLNVTGDTFTGPVTTEVLTLDGIVLFTYGGTVNGERQGP